MEIIDTKHVIKTIEFLEAKAAEYAEQMEKQHTENMEGWYEGRGGAFESAAKWLRNDLLAYAEDMDAPIAHLID